MPFTLLVIECSGHLNWYQTFEGASILGQPVQVEQAEWDDLTVVSYHDSGAVVSMRRAKRPFPGTSQERDRTAVIDFVLLRSVSHGIKGQDSRNKLMSLIHARLPSVNSLMSAYLCLERPIVFAELKTVQKQLGKENFPLINQTMYSRHSDMIITPDCPFVGKVGHAHSGYGKAKIKSSEEFQDFKSICALHGDYITLEDFVEWDWDGRVQKIGRSYRAFKRTSPNWKGNVGNMSVIEDLPLTPELQSWIDASSSIFGGLDICALDFVHRADGKLFILELNDTAIGLVHKYAGEDMLLMRDLVLLRMEEKFGVKEEGKEETGEVIGLQEEVRLLKKQIARSLSVPTSPKTPPAPPQSSSTPYPLLFGGGALAGFLFSSLLAFFWLRPVNDK
eukprot:TRINITY_DN2313_c0_g1_i2.p1 TRINITY_DN2313_c0_g1~~TRINITY_DN2313_c0_g1_i2.p1  ORF type:complete len:391 (-),score=51.28 TRINITY_DN2313_c0_g1_i2:17-1189(-)